MEKGLRTRQVAEICSELVAKKDPKEALGYVEDYLKQIPGISLQSRSGNLIAELNKDVEQTVTSFQH